MKGRSTRLVLALLMAGSVHIASAAVTVPVTMMEGMPVVPVRLGIIKIDFMLDLGGAVAITVPGELIVPSAGVTQLAEKTKTTDASGAVYEVHRVKVADASIGDAKLGELDGLVNYSWGLVIDKAAEQPDVIKKGIVGLKAFEKRGVVLDLGRGKLSVMEPGEEPQMDAKWFNAPLTIDKRGAVVRMSLNGTDADMVLDSGAPMTVMKRGAAALVKANDVCKGKPADVAVCGPTTFKSAKLGEGQIKRLEFLVVAMGPLPFDGMLGMDFFKRNVVYLDMVRGRMFYRPV